MMNMNQNNMMNINNNNMMNMNQNNMMINMNNNFNQNLNNNAMNMGNIQPEVNINNYSFQANIINNNNNFANSNFNNNNMPNNQYPNCPDTLSSNNEIKNDNVRKTKQFNAKKFLQILKESTEYKLSDFGLSKLKSDIKKRNLCGSPLYMSPELFKLDSTLSEIENKAVDIWALGILTYELYFGKRPFEAFSIEELSQMYEKGTYIINLRELKDKKISKELFFFMNKCLQKVPEKRANVYELRNGDFLNYDVTSSDKMGEMELRNFLKGIVEVDLNGNFILNINKDYEEEIKIRNLNKMWTNNN